MGFYFLLPEELLHPLIPWFNGSVCMCLCGLSSYYSFCLLDNSEAYLLLHWIQGIFQRWAGIKKKM
jgi:hypothetical protein